MSALSLRLPDSIHNKLRDVAKKDNISINQFISSAVSEKLAVFLAEDYLSRRAAKADKEKFKAALSAVPDIPVDNIDKL